MKENSREIEKKNIRLVYLPFDPDTIEKVWAMYVYGIALSDICQITGVDLVGVEEIIDSIV
jgi:hypothetical protein